MIGVFSIGVAAGCQAVAETNDYLRILPIIKHGEHNYQQAEDAGDGYKFFAVHTIQSYGC